LHDLKDLTVVIPLYIFAALLSIGFCRQNCRHLLQTFLALHIQRRAHVAIHVFFALHSLNFADAVVSPSLREVASLLADSLDLGFSEFSFAEGVGRIAFDKVKVLQIFFSLNNSLLFSEDSLGHQILLLLPFLFNKFLFFLLLSHVEDNTVMSTLPRACLLSL